MHTIIIPDTSQRYSWGEISWNWHGVALHVSCYSDSHLTLVISFGYPCFFIKLPKFIKNADVMETGYGFSFYADTIHFMLGKTKVWSFPWSWSHFKTWELTEAGWTEVPIGTSYGEVGMKETFDYRYTLRNGTIQERKATIYVSRMEHRWRLFKWLPIPRKRSTSIWCNFDDEIGERTGSWKGGVTGCGEQMRPGESPRDTLLRMERTRVFK